MEKRDLTEDLKKFNGGSGLITKTVLTNYFRLSNPRYVDKYLYGLDCIDGKYYLITDLVSVLMQHRCKKMPKLNQPYSKQIARYQLGMKSIKKAV